MTLATSRPLLRALAVLTLVCSVCATPQSGPPPASEQLNTYGALQGSDLYNEAAARIAASGLDAQTQQAAQVAIDFERSNWATESVFSDGFYTLPDNATTVIPGDLLKIEQQTNVTSFTVPPQLALSRFLYQTETLNGSSVPASGFVLWPWMPHQFDDCSGFPVVAWAHGTSGLYPECAPSHVQNLWYQFAAPFTLALQGYVVVGVDYAGLGVNETSDGEPVAHEWLASPAGVFIRRFFAVEAVHKAWPSELSTEFVVLGHSQGGSVAWSAAQRQYEKPVSGYLGSIAASPLVDIAAYFASVPPETSAPYVALLANTVASVFPNDFEPSLWLSSAGLQALDLLEGLNGCQSVFLELFGTPGVEYATAGSVNSSWYLDTFNKLVSAAGKPFAGPMLVLQGTADITVPEAGTTQVVNETCSNVPDADLEYVLFEGADHVPTMFASQQIWLDWIAARFNGVKSQGKCTTQMRSPALDMSGYQKVVSYFLERPQYAYEVA